MGGIGECLCRHDARFSLHFRIMASQILAFTGAKNKLPAPFLRCPYEDGEMELLCWSCRGQVNNTRVESRNLSLGSGAAQQRTQ
jgi:hypothetical protein